MKAYTCTKCKDTWEFFPDDYKYKKKLYPTKCPFCSMPVTQMITDIYKIGGLTGVIRQLVMRYL